MKNSKKISLGIILLYFFLLSTVALIVILLFRLMPENSKIVVNIWIAEFLLSIGYCLFFYDASKVKKNDRKRITATRH
jgi:hypothetical protein